jgi:hypothetical protein
LPFEEARKYVQTLGIKNVKEWNVYSKSDKKLKDIPSNPQLNYQNEGWISFGDWFGTGVIAASKKVFREFINAKEFVNALNLKSKSEWSKYCESGNKPINIPVNPSRTYKNKGWEGFGDWLGTGTTAYQEIKYRKFSEARKFTHLLNLKSIKEWGNYCKSKNLPLDIPSNPQNTYKADGWLGYGDWLGTGTISTRDKIYLTYSEAQEIVKTLNIKSQKDWSAYCASENKLVNIPSSPQKTYKNKGWTSMGDWLGTGAIATFNRKYKNFEEAKAFAQGLGLSSSTQWREFVNSGEIPEDIPSSPQKVYKNNGWINMGDWVGTNNIATRLRVYMPFYEARDYVRKLQLKGNLEWREYSKSIEKSIDIPTAPDKIYKNSGWVNWGNWLGTEYVNHKDRAYLNFEEARAFIRNLKLKNQKEWKDYCKSNMRPDNIPSNPNRKYKKEGWESIGDWIGNGVIAASKITFRDFENAKHFVSKLDIKNVKDWTTYSKSEKKPKDIPSNPQKTYLNKGWKGWANFLGKEED